MNNEIERKENCTLIVPRDRKYVGSSPFTSIEIREEKHNADAWGEVAIIQTYVGDSEKNENGFKVIIKADQPLKDGNKSRKLSASVLLSDSEIMALAEFVTNKRKEHSTVKLER